MELKNLLFETSDGIATVTVNRPDKLNALNALTMEEFAWVFEQVSADDAIKAAILTGAGQKSFVAGADINEFLAMDMLKVLEHTKRGLQILNEMEGLNKPLIAAVNGFALGGGCELILACHLRVAAENARFGLPEVSLGIIPGFGGTQRLPRLVGKGKALELIMTGDMIDAQEAYRIGLVNKVVPQGELMETCRNLAKRILSRGPLAVRLAMQAVHVGLNVDLESGFRHESTLGAICFASEDRAEGVQAFIEKRAAVFKGR